MLKYALYFKSGPGLIRIRLGQNPVHGWTVTVKMQKYGQFVTAIVSSRVYNYKPWILKCSSAKNGQKIPDLNEMIGYYIYSYIYRCFANY